MNKKIIGRVILGLVVLVIILFSYWICKEIRHKIDVVSFISVLPELPLWDVDSNRFEIPQSSKQSVLVHFNSTCDHCQKEVADIGDRIQEFKNVNIVFISTESIKSIKSFAVSNELDNSTNVSFTKINEADLYKIFGHVVNPHIFIYNPKGKLVKEFKGETKIDAIVKYL